MQDGGVRVPFIVCMPGTVPAAESDLIFSTPDIYPTLLKAAGLSLRPDQHVDGMDLWSHWLGDERTPRGPVFWHYPHYSNQGGTPGAAVRHGIFKLVRWFEDGREALYDLSSDVSEAIDIAATYPSVAKELARLLDEWSDDVCALVPQPNAHQYFLRD
jgi:arylsulfatase A-like enzyme